MLSKKSSNQLSEEESNTVKASNPGAKPPQPTLFPSDPSMRQANSPKKQDNPSASSTVTSQETYPAKKPMSALATTTATNTKPAKTKVIVQYDVGFNNALTIRGKGANLSWEKGISLTNTKPDEWVWETDMPFSHCEFKVLVNDEIYEAGENHSIKCGASFQYTPIF